MPSAAHAGKIAQESLAEIAGRASFSSPVDYLGNISARELSLSEEATHLMSWKNANLSSFGQESHSPLQHNEKFIAPS